MTAPLELSIVLPCLNEAETLETCVNKAQRFLREHQVAGEVIVADNGSTDGSQAMATRAGARLITVDTKGYGSALMGGIGAATGRFIITGDADDSHDLAHLRPFLERLREGYDLVIGNRFLGGIKPGAMRPLNRYLGNPLLSAIGRLFFRSPVRDFQCGLRGFTKAAATRMDLRTTGMEFASELIVKASLLGLRVAEVPTTLSPAGRTRPSHLRPWRDGWRHVRFLLRNSPRRLLLYPIILLILLGVIAVWLLVGGVAHAGTVRFTLDPPLDVESRMAYQLIVSIPDRDPSATPRFQETIDIEASDIFTKREETWWLTSRWTRVVSSRNGAAPSRDAYLELLLGDPLSYAFDDRGGLLEIQGIAALAAKLKAEGINVFPTTEALTQHFQRRWEAWTSLSWDALAGRTLIPGVPWERSSERPWYNPPLGRIPMKQRWTLLESSPAEQDAQVHLRYEFSSDPTPVHNQTEQLQEWLAWRVPEVEQQTWSSVVVTLQGEMWLDPARLTMSALIHHEEITLHAQADEAQASLTPQGLRILLQVTGHKISEAG